MTNDRVVGKSTYLHADRIICAQQATRFPYVIWFETRDVVIEEEDAGPVEHVTEQEGEIALCAQVGPACEDGPVKEFGGLPVWQTQPCWRRDIYGDQVHVSRNKLRCHGSRRPFSAMQGHQGGA